MDLLVAYSTAVMSLGYFTLEPIRFEPALGDVGVDEVSCTVADGWAVAEPLVRRIAVPVADEATVTGLIDAIDTVMAEFVSGDPAARKRALEGIAFEAQDDIGLQRFGLISCTGRDAV